MSIPTVTAAAQPASARISWPLRITLCDLPPSPNRRMCWQERRRLVRPLVDGVVLQARAVGLPQPLQYAHVVATLVHRRPPLRDFDNAVASLKEVIDALVVGRLVASDAPENFTMAVVQVIGPQRGLVLEIWPQAGARVEEDVR